MKIEIERKITVKEFLGEVRKKYGSLTKLKKYVKSHPKDVEAKLDLEDYKFYLKHQEYLNDEIKKGVSHVFWDLENMALLTSKRLQILDTIKRQAIVSINHLSDILGRDPKNVYQDLKILYKLGVVSFEKGRGKALIPTICFNKIEITV